MKNLRRIAASFAAAAITLTAAQTAAPVAMAGTPAMDVAGATPLATVNVGATPGIDATWRQLVQDRPDRVKEMWAYSPSMDRNVPMLVLTAGDNSTPRPIVYALNGGDGGEGQANWAAQTDIIDFYWDKNVNVVIPMSGKFSYYTDWVSDVPQLGGKQMWETFLTKELPTPLEQTLGANSQRAIMGLSMSATTTLLYAQHQPGFYDAIGSFSGCAETSKGVGLLGIDKTLERAGTTREAMWGPLGTGTWHYNDALINSEKLRGTPMYISNASGMIGENDVMSAPQVKGNPLAVMVLATEGAGIEAATNKCTHDLKAKLDSQGIGADWNLRPTGTHSWGYWQEDLYRSWETFRVAFGM